MDVSNISGEFNHAMWADFLEEALRKDYFYLKLIHTIVLFCIFAVSLIGNTLTCVVIYYDKSMHTATNYYLFNLAVSDLIVTFAILLEVHELLSDAYTFSQLVCQIHFVCVVGLWNNSILTMTALSIERYLAIWHPLKVKSTPVWRRVAKIIMLLWLIAILETFPEMFTVSVTKIQQSTVCFTIPTAMARVLNGALAVITFLVPLMIMSFVYLMIALKVNVTQKKNSRDQIFNYRNPRRKVNKLIAMTLSFLVCWLPFFTLRVMVSALDLQQLRAFAKWWGIGFKVVSINSWFSIVLNPILFSLMSTKFRKALKRQEAERAAVASVERQMGYIIQIAMDEDAEILAERNVLRMELDNEMRALNTFKQALDANQDATREHLQEMLDLQHQLSNIATDTTNLLTSLQRLREQNHAALKADPIYALVQEERSLQQQLDDMGIYVHPATGSDEHYHSF